MAAVAAVSANKGNVSSESAPHFLTGKNSVELIAYYNRNREVFLGAMRYLSLAADYLNLMFTPTENLYLQIAPNQVRP